MVQKIGPEETSVIVKFGGGLNTRPPEDEINDREAAGGQNFLLDVKNSELRNRKPFDLVATAPNAGSILGGGSYVNSSGVVKAFIQAGDTVYDFDGTAFDASPILDTVNANAQLRGHWRTHSWTLDDKVLVTDLSLNEVVKEWDGTTWQDVTFTDQSGAGFGNFFAKYLSVSNERAVFSNIKDASATPHMVVGAKRGAFTQITVTNRPSSAIALDDPFFLLSPDLKPINGHVEAFGTTLISTEAGELFNLTGSDSQDFAFGSFYPGSAGRGEESLLYIGNDVIYGRPGRIESARDTDRFGDSEADDITLDVADQIKGYNSWTSVYNSRLNRVYLFPSGQSEVWVFQTGMRGGETSPWMKFVTNHALAFQPTFVQSMLDPSDGLEYIFMGDSSGNVYRMEGTGASGDGGSSTITTEWLSKLFTAPFDSEIYDIEGWIKYRRGAAFQVAIQLEYAGENIFDSAITVDVPANVGTDFYTGSKYYTNSVYYGSSFTDRLVRQQITIPGGSNEFQVRVTVDDVDDFTINEIGLRFRAAS